MIKVAINGFGRIGKALTRIIMSESGIQLVAINDLADIEVQAHLLKYDSVHGRYEGEVSSTNEALIVNGNNIRYTSFEHPKDIDWGQEVPDVVIEATGKFLNKEDALHHLDKGVKKVIFSAPSKSDDVKTILMGINDDIITQEDRILSNASCTTNSVGPLIQILDEKCGIKSAYITTVHSYTGDQRLHDSPHRDLRRARAGAQSIIPTTTGAAKAITKIFTHLDGKIGGAGIRVPVPNGSLTDISCVVERPLGISEINSLFKEAANSKMTGILEYTEDPIVSRDIIGNTHSCVFDAQLTSVIGNMIKVVGWYDNEIGYSHRLKDLILKVS